MSNSCPPAPINKKEYIADLGKVLVQDYVKRNITSLKKLKKLIEKQSGMTF